MNSDSGEFQAIASAMSGALDQAVQPSAEPSTVRAAVPTDQDQLFEYLRKGSYKEFPSQESSIHPSAGPHSKYGRPVRVFLDPVLDASLKAGNESHPAGSSAVKEMYTPDGELEGWAVMVKTGDESQGGKGWFWYEVTSTTDPKPFAVGNGVPLCFGCHGTGNDYVLTSYPLR